MSVVAKQQANHKAKRHRLFASKGLAAKEETKGVDHEAKVIRGYKVMSIGEAKGHGQEVDATTLEQVYSLGQKAGEKGIKSRFTHPGLSSDGMGTYLGRTKNFRIEGESVLADLHLSPRAFDTPNGDLGSYVLNLADSDPDQFGASVVISMHEEYRLNEDGTPTRDADGERLPPLIRVDKLHASDIVDEPAANEGFFSVNDDSIPDYPAREAFALMDRIFGNADAEVISERLGKFVQSYLSAKGKPQMATEAKVETQPEVKAEAEKPVIDEAALSAAKDQSGKEAAEAERRRSADIVAACNLAKKPDLAAEFISQNKSLSEVNAVLLKSVCEDRKPADEGGTGSPIPAQTDENAKYRAEYAQHKQAYLKEGVSEDDYVKTRRIDDGLDTLMPNIDAA